MSTMNKRSQEALTWRGTVATCINCDTDYPFSSPHSGHFAFY